MADTILVIGSSGQIGIELVDELRSIYGNDNVIASDIQEPQIKQAGPFETLDVLDKEQLLQIVKKHNVKEVYLLAALLSATSEENPEFAWNLNMNSLFHVLNLAKDKIINKVFWPSSIAVFGPSTPKINTPQHVITEPTTIYGISKQAGERWCEYYHNRYGVDVRSIRFPGLIGYKSKPGGGTTDYAVDIFHQAIQKNKYTCFLAEDTTLPMMYMSDAIRATIDIMQAHKKNITIRSSYNIAGTSFSPKELALEIQKYLPHFQLSCVPDNRQKIAEGWPKSINDEKARKDWNWEAKYQLKALTKDMIEHLQVLLMKNV